MRSRLWSLILRELPFPFREIGMEVARAVRWIDQTAARFWIALGRSPAWFLVTGTGAVAVILTILLFFSYVCSHDPTLGELANRSQILVPTTREHLEEAGDWAAQDKWRVAHFFVDHRPRKHKTHSRDTLLTNFQTAAPLPVAETSIRPAIANKKGFGPRMARVETHVSAHQLTFPEPDVMLDLGTPRVAENPKRIVDGQLVREPGADFHPVRLAANYPSRDSRLLVHAEWSFASECDSEPVRRPTRRMIPVPDPNWDDLPPVPDLTDDRHPDLSFQMTMLREFLPAVGEFPPRSRLVSVSADSEFLDSFENTHRSHPQAEDFSPWTRTRSDRAEPDRPAESYAERMGAEEAARPAIDELERDLRLHPAPSFAEVALRMEVQAPKSTVAGRDNQSSLVLHNDGLRAIPLVTVRESLSGLETVTDAIPPARVDQFDNSLERKVQHLEPGKDQRLELVWRADSEGRRTHSATIIVTSAVEAMTEIVPPVGDQPMPSVAPEPISPFEPEVEPIIEPEPIREPEPIPETHPKLSFDVQNQPRALVDDLVEIAIVVRNTGDVPLHDVRVIARLPEQLKHRRGGEVEYTIESLPVQGSQRAVLRVVAESAGRAICRLHVAAAEPAEANSRAVIDIDAKPVPPRPQPVAKAEPPRPKAPMVIPKRVTPAPVVSKSNCCCQSQFAETDYEPWFGP